MTPFVFFEEVAELFCVMPAFDSVVTPLTFDNVFCFLSFFFSQGDTVYATVMPEVDEKEMEKTVNPIVREYFEHGDTKEVQVSSRRVSIHPLRSWKI